MSLMVKRVLPVLVLVIWLPGLLILYPFPRAHQAVTESVAADSSERSSVQPAMHEPRIGRPLSPWLDDALHVSIGIAAGIIGILGIQGWRLMALIAGVFSLAISWAAAMEHRLASSLLYFPTDNFALIVLQEKVRFSEFVIKSTELSAYLKFVGVYFELLMPIFQLLLVPTLLAVSIRHAFRETGGRT